MLSKELLEPVVKIFAVKTEPDYSMPVICLSLFFPHFLKYLSQWQMKRQKRSTSSGFIISGQRIITAAHCVANWTSGTVLLFSLYTKYIYYRLYYSCAQFVFSGQFDPLYSHGPEARFSQEVSGKSARSRARLRCRLLKSLRIEMKSTNI